MKLYANRDPIRLEPFYSMHVSAMTSEALHSKSDIAAELAFRDAEIAKLMKELTVVQNQLLFTLAATEPNHGAAEVVELRAVVAKLQARAEAAEAEAMKLLTELGDPAPIEPKP
jgi:hypothetical protein